MTGLSMARRPFRVFRCQSQSRALTHVFLKWTFSTFGLTLTLLVLAIRGCIHGPHGFANSKGLVRLARLRCDELARRFSP